MTISSVQPISSITLSDDQITALTSSIDTITLTSTPTTCYSYSYNNTSCISNYTSSTATSGFSTITLNDSSISWGIDFPEEFVNSFPDWVRIEKMCETYPGLKIAFEKFKTTYYLVKDDYDTPKDSK